MIPEPYDPDTVTPAVIVTVCMVVMACIVAWYTV